jgi:hypothetical protein|tara:strand:- start:117 stop:701 length:585 start_codon:yes stop_codon:yes gene_type:complete
MRIDEVTQHILEKTITNGTSPRDNSALFGKKPNSPGKKKPAAVKPNAVASPTNPNTPPDAPGVSPRDNSALFGKKPKPLQEEVTLEDTQDFHEEYGYLGYSVDDNDMFEAEYQGRKVKLNKPMQGDVKKFKVYVKNPKGNVIKVNFGHGGSSVKGKAMRIRKNNPKARKSFRARHNCANPGPKTKARYWSCRKW